jgi:hypothetical protein
MDCIKFIQELSAALLTPVIGVVTTIILVNQYRMEKRRWRLDLFEKRYAVFRSTMEYIGSMMRHGKSTVEAQASFLEGTRDRALLFKDEIQALLDEIWKDSIDLEMHQEIFKDLPVGEERTKHVHAAADIKKKLPELGKRAQDIFGGYLKLTEK